MSAEQIDRLTLLSEKVVKETASFDELTEFKILLKQWNKSIPLSH
jgi:hypothetical protein